MADIQTYINNILNAVYGEEVRASLVNALAKINADNEKYLAIKQEVVKAKDTVVDQIVAFDAKHDKALQTIADLLKVASDAAVMQGELQTATNAAERKRGELDEAVNDATSKITDVIKVQDALRATITTAVQTKEDLAASNAAGAQTKTDLDAAIKAANLVVEEIGNTLTNIDTTAEEQLTAIRNAGTEEIEKVQQAAAEIVADREQIQQNKENAAALKEDLIGKLDKQQGIENAGKALVIREDGNVVPGEMQSGGGDGIAIINTMSSASPLVIPDSAERVNKGFGLIGNTEQFSTTGAQLLDKDNFFVNPPTTFDELKYYPLNIGNKECTLSTTCPMKGSTTNLFLMAGNVNRGASSSVNGVGFGTSRTAKSQDGYVTIALRTQGDNPNNPLDYDIMLNYGSTAKPYEPYTGGKPSPSPEYPQEIKSVGKWNEEKQKYEVSVRVTGKNLLNQELLKNELNFDETIHPQGYWQYFIYLSPNTKYTISRKNKDGYQSKRSIKVTTIKNSTSGQWLMATHSASENKQSVTLTTSDTGLISINFFVKDINDVIEALKIAGYLQIECGEAMTDFEPYRKPQTLTLTSDRPITKWDKLVEQDGQIGWLYKGKISDIPKRGYISRNGMSNNYYFNIENIFNDAVDSSSSPVINSQYFTHFKLGNPYSEKGNLAWIYKVGQSSNLRIAVEDGSIVTAEEFEKYISNKDMKILYELAEPEFIPLLQSEQDAIRDLKTYYPTTVVTADGGEVDPNIEVTYTADTKNYIDQKIEAINKAVVTTQKALI